MVKIGFNPSKSLWVGVTLTLPNTVSPPPIGPSWKKVLISTISPVRPVNPIKIASNFLIFPVSDLIRITRFFQLNFTQVLLFLFPANTVQIGARKSFRRMLIVRPLILTFAIIE